MSLPETPVNMCFPNSRELRSGATGSLNSRPIMSPLPRTSLILGEEGILDMRYSPTSAAFWTRPSSVMIPATARAAAIAR